MSGLMKAVRTLDGSRERMMAQHDALRELMVATKEALAAPDAPTVEAAVRELTAFFLKHLRLEERELFPVIRDLDPWGPIRVDQLLEGHETQRAIVAALVDQLERGVEVALLKTDVEWFIHLLDVDIAEEDELFMSLSDDCVSAGQEAG